MLKEKTNSRRYSFDGSSAQISKPFFDLYHTPRELLAGTIAGWGSVITGSPFDIVKVRIQTQQQYKGAVDCLKKTISQEGFLALYKGIVPPLMICGGMVALQFAVYKGSTRMFQGYLGSDEELPIPYVFLSGAITGFCNSILATPIEHIRTRVAITNKPVQISYGHLNENVSSTAMAKNVYQKLGIRGIYKGGLSIIYRDTPFNGFSFGIYEILCRYLNKKEKKWYSPFVAGSFSGFIVGFLNYPFDVIKAKIQSDTLSNPKYKGIMDCIRKTTKAEGVNGLYKGLATNVARAVPCNAIYFGLFHYTMQLLNPTRS